MIIIALFLLIPFTLSHCPVYVDYIERASDLYRRSVANNSFIAQPLLNTFLPAIISLQGERYAEVEIMEHAEQILNTCELILLRQENSERLLCSVDFFSKLPRRHYVTQLKAYYYTVRNGRPFCSSYDILESRLESTDPMVLALVLLWGYDEADALFKYYFEKVFQKSDLQLYMMGLVSKGILPAMEKPVNLTLETQTMFEVLASIDSHVRSMSGKTLWDRFFLGGSIGIFCGGLGLLILGLANGMRT